MYKKKEDFIDLLFTENNADSAFDTFFFRLHSNIASGLHISQAVQETDHQ
jgi:hypothetical protein